METISLYPWQEPLTEAVVRSLERHRVFISGFPTGAGKTVIALAAAKRVGGPHLVIAPKVALTQWWRTAEAMGCPSIVDVINPEKISTPRGCQYYTRTGKWKLPASTTVIWDEPHRSASGITGVTTQALAELKAYSGVRLHAMTATLADSPMKLRALGWWTDLHKFNDSSFYDWCRRHGCAMEEQRCGHYPDGSPKTKQVFRFTRIAATAKAVMEQIRRDMGEQFMAIKADDIPGFPTQTVDTLLLDLSARDTAEIKAAHEEMSARMKSIAASDEAEVGRLRERVEFTMAEAVAEITAGFVEDGNNVVVFFNFHEPRRRFEAALAKRDISFASVYGDQKDDRQLGIDRFQRNEINVMSISAKAGGASLNLHDELKQRPRVSLILPSWDSAAVKQCLGRIRRCNGTHATQYFVLAAGTIQENVAKSLKRKLNNIDSLNDADFSM